MSSIHTDVISRNKNHAISSNTTSTYSETPPLSQTKTQLDLAHKQQHQIREIKKRQELFFKSSKTLSYEFRLQQLNTLESVILSHEDEIIDALKIDLGKSPTEALLTEVSVVCQEIRHVKKCLKKWMSPDKVTTPLMLSPARSSILNTPKGNVLIFSPWNYPFQLVFSPLIGAIAAGNCVFIKPSEVSRASSKVLKKMISLAFQDQYIAIMEGGADLSEQLMSFSWDHVFFTGSTAVGRKVAVAAARSLTPTTLELGGKSPCIVAPSASITVAAKRIAWGKFFNVGQTCVAPDYVIVHKSVKELFLKELVRAIESLFPSDIRSNEDYGRVVNDHHIRRLSTLLEGQKIYYGGDLHVEDRFLSPTILDEPSLSSPIMKEEIFGPILPVLTYEHIDDLAPIIDLNPNPLALYLFTERKKDEELIFDRIVFGGGCVNDTIAHLANTNLPFGGIKESGMGSSHGRFTFDEFSHKKAKLKNTTWIDPSIRYQPYNQLKTRMIKFFASYL